MKTINKKHYRGTSSVEAAFVLVWLIMLTLAIIAISVVFLRAQDITNLARHGARIGCRDGANSATVTDELNPLMLVDYTITKNEISSTVGEPVKVEVSGNNLDFLGVSTKGFIGVPIPNTFSAQVTMSKEGPSTTP